MDEGIIVQVVPVGLAYLEDKASKKRFAFQFGRIQNYAGESAKELGLRVGVEVRFRATGDWIEEVELINPAKRRKR